MSHDVVVRHRFLVVVLAVAAMLMLLLALFRIGSGDPLAGVGHGLVAILAILAALLVNNPRREHRIQRPLVITALILAPVAVAVLITSMLV